MSSTKDCGCLRDADGKIDMTRCPIHPTPSTKDPKSHNHTLPVSVTCEACYPTPQATKPELVSVSPKEFGEAYFKRHDEATKPVDEQIDDIFRYVGDNGYHENRGARVDCGSCKSIDMAKSRVLALISNQVASAVREAEIRQTQKINQWLIQHDQATKPVDELTMTVYFTERQLSELKAGEKLELPLTDDLRQAISNQVASAVKEAQALIAQEVQKARGCVDCGELRCENCKRLWQT